MKSLILVLGSPNDKNGNLGQIALDRIGCAYGLYASNSNIAFLCTGGFGQHFNTTTLPHAHYAKQALIAKGAHQDHFLPLVESSNTYEDFEKSKPIIEAEAPGLLIVVTSDFHIERAGILQRTIINYPNVILVPAKSSISEQELVRLREHEKNAIKRIKEN
jgi:uncharacterized SAM-binding protein YcdF (DUF218 family)